jgi:integrase/recombinase XerD
MTSQALIPQPASDLLRPQSGISVLPSATSASNDQELVDSWLASLGSQHTRANFAMTGARFLEALAKSLRQATVEEVRAALMAITAGAAASTSRQYVARVKSLLSYAHRLGYTMFNAGAVIKVHKEARALAKRIITEVEAADVIRSSTSQRDYLLVAVGYAGGLRVSELVGLNCGDVLLQEKGRVQLHIVGKGGKERQVLLPADLGPRLLALTAGRPPDAPVFVSQRANGRRAAGSRLTARAVNYLVKRLAERAGVSARLSPHWLRHAHASHAIDRGAPLPLVAATLGHGNVSTTSVYLHARPGAASGDALDPGIWKARHGVPTGCPPKEKQA